MIQETIEWVKTVYATPSAEVDQLDIAQLRCGVLLQLLHIEALKKERDALAAAAKLALDAAVDAYATCDWPFGDDGQKAMESLSKAIEALRQAGVQ